MDCKVFKAFKECEAFRAIQVRLEPKDLPESKV
jgi:hypothetical protein